jgi:hypothetical protein
LLPVAAEHVTELIDEFNTEHDDHGLRCWLLELIGAAWNNSTQKTPVNCCGSGASTRTSADPTSARCTPGPAAHPGGRDGIAAKSSRLVERGSVHFLSTCRLVDVLG